jgi:hypothetical protein
LIGAFTPSRPPIATCSPTRPPRSQRSANRIAGASPHA